MEQPFTLEQAIEIAEDFEDLTDTTAKDKNGNILTITHVVACPYNDNEKRAFAQQCITQTEKSPNELLSEYPASAYDVIIISHDKSKKAWEILDIRSYISLNGINYRFL